MANLRVTDQEVDELLASPEMKQLLTLTAMKAKVELAKSLAEVYETHEPTRLSTGEVAANLRHLERALRIELAGFQQAISL